VPTLSPSMDIQISSNVERLLFELNHRDGGMTAEQMRRFREVGSLVLEPDQYSVLLERFDGARVDDEATLAVIKAVHEETGLLVDPHTAVGIAAARAQPRRADDAPVVVLATAHPAKFPDAVERATGIRPALPTHLRDLLDRPERTAVVANDLAAVQRLVASVTPG
jgi:threonine synthase